MTLAPHRPSLDDMRATCRRLAPYLRPTPLVELDLGLPGRRLYLKLETLQPIGAFKIRPALNVVLSRQPDALRHGIATVSSGNMAYGMAWAARAAGVPMAAYMVPDAPRSKIDGVRALGGEVRFVDAETWWRYIVGAERPQAPELFINPVTDQALLAGNGSLGLEIVEDLPEVDVVMAPFGGGSLATGVASGVKALRPQAQMLAVEAEHATPVTAALAAGGPVETPCRPSFIRSIGGPMVVPALWPLARAAIDGVSVVSLAQVADAVRLLFERAKIVAEGAGAASLAAAMADPRARGNVVCIISGGNIDAGVYAQILAGQLPG
jgi:threonine dehydratase